MAATITRSPSVFNFYHESVVKEFRPLMDLWKIFPASADPVLRSFEQEKSGWSRFKERFTTETELTKSVRLLSQRPNLHDNWDTHKTILINGFKAQEFLKIRPYLRNIIKKLTPIQLNDIFQRLVLESDFKQDITYFQKCLDLITAEELEILLKFQIPRFMDAISSAKEINARLEGSESQFFDDIINSTSKNKTKRKSFEMVRLLNRLIDTIVASLSYFGIGKVPGSSWEASHFIQVWGKILLMPLTLFLALNTFFVSAATALIITASVIVAVGIAIFAYQKWLRPRVEELSGAINMTKEIESAQFRPLVGRNAEIQDIANNLMEGNAVLLEGATGTGKTELVYGLAQAIKQGKFPGLQGKQVFLIKISELLNDGVSFDSSDNFQKLIDRLGIDIENSILFFDEIHVVMSEKFKVRIGTKFLNYLGANGEKKIPFCIAATNQQITDEAFRDRFGSKSVKITEVLACQILRAMAPEIDISNQMIKRIVDLTKKAGKPGVRDAKRLLNRAVGALRNYESPELRRLEQEYQQLNAESLLEGHWDLRVDSPEEQAISEKRQKLKQEIDSLKQMLAIENRQIEEMNVLKKFAIKEKKGLYKIVSQIASEQLNTSGSSTLERMKKQLLFSQYYLLPWLQNEIQEKSNRISKIPTRIDESLLKELLE